jgi:NNP family nitrate/nitrite transporter-like MFS transporter
MRNAGRFDMIASDKSCSSSQNPFDQPFRNQLGPLLLLTFIFFVNFISRIASAPLAPRIEKELNLSHADAGTLFLMISIGYFCALIGSGFISSRLNHKRIIMISTITLGLALIGISFCSGLWTLRLGLFVVGIAAGLYLPSGIATLTSLISSRNWGKALAIHEIAPNLSFIVAPLLCEFVLVWFSWRMVFLLMGTVSLLVCPVFMRYSRGGDFKGEAPGMASFKQLFGNISIWILVFLFSLAVIGTLGIYAMLPLYLVSEHGMDINQANSLIALSRVPCMLMAFVGGWATDRFGPQRTLRIVLFCTGLVTFFLGIASGPVIGYIVFFQPLAAASFFPAGFAAMSLMVSARLRNMAVSLVMPLAFVVGGGLAPVFIGYIGDMGSFALSITLCGVLIMAGSAVTLALKFHKP